MTGRRFEIADQRDKIVVARIGLAPENPRQRGETMILDRGDFGRFEFEFALAGAGDRPERPVALVPPGATRDLRHFRCGQPAAAHAVELGQTGKGDMIEIEVESHPDRIGRDEVIDLARLEQIDLRIAGAGAQRAGHHRSPAAQAAQHFGGGIDFLGRKRDHRRALGQAGHFLGRRMGERRKARPPGDFGAGQ